jgi:hypothetical protein
MNTSKNLIITGQDDVIKGLQQALDKMIFASERGLVTAGMFIKNKAAQKAPIDTGNLRNSGYVVSNSGKLHSETPSFSDLRKDSAIQAANFASAVAESRAIVSGKQPKVMVGFATTYAASVHEHTDVPHATGEAKFLENTLKDMASQILRLIKSEAFL